MSAWMRLRRRRIGRRAVLRTATRAGIGAVGLALVGCSDDGEDSPGVVAEPEQRTERSRAVQASSAEAQGAPASAQSGATGTVTRIEPKLAIGVDPIDWRTRFHWSKLATLPGHASGPRHGGELQIDAPSTETWSPVSSSNRFYPGGHPFGSLLPLLYSQLVTIDADDFANAHRTNVGGDLATGWEWPDDTTVLFQLHEGVSWPEMAPVDGRALTAEDVKVAHDALRVEGAREASTYAAVEQIEADDAAHIVTFRLARPAAYLLNKMTAPSHVIAPPEVLADPDQVNWVRDSIGTGPFRLGYSSGVGKWSVTRNPSYFKRDAATGAQLPYLDAVSSVDLLFGELVPSRESTRLGEWQAGRVQSVRLMGTAEAEQALDAHPDAVLQVTAPTPGQAPLLTFRSLDRGPYRDARVRRALSMALDRTELAASLYDGFAAPDCGLHWAFVEDAASDWGFREWPWELSELGAPYQLDIDTANALLSSAGYDAAAPLTITIDAPPSPGPTGASVPDSIHGPIVKSVGEQWQRAFGGSVRIEPLERIWKRESAGENRSVIRVEQDPDADLLFSPLPSYGVDPDDLVYRLMHSDSVYTGAGINDPEIDEWGIAQRQATDASERSELLERIRLKESDEAWRLHLVNPYAIRVRREHALNLVDAYFASSLDLLPKQLERAWLAG